MRINMFALTTSFEPENIGYLIGCQEKRRLKNAAQDLD